MPETHEVFNQPPALVGYEPFAGDVAFFETVHRYGGGWARDRLAAVARTVGGEDVQALARQANRFPPELRTHDRFGRRVDEVEFHPAWHELMRMVWASGTHSIAWTEQRPGAHIARFALCYLWNQAENGVMCPTAMTYAGVPVLRRGGEAGTRWAQKVVSTRYDPRPIPAAQKSGAICAMAMTEKQGGSDLRAVTTRAEPALDGTWRLFGHKWFFSVPQADVFLTVARTGETISCFLVPGWLPEGRRNNLRLQRLKEKVGNRSNASSEIELDGAEARLVGEEGRGIATIIEMAHLTRLDCGIGSAAIMRQALTQAIHHASHRTAFQKKLVDQPAMRAVLADLALESEAAMAVVFRLVAALEGEGDEGERLLNRIGAPIAKYWVCKRTPGMVVEAMECHGGNGYVEEANLGRLYREAPLNGIWEGSGNVICLDVLRAMGKTPATVDVFIGELRRARGGDRRLDAFMDALADDLARRPSEGAARALVERMAVALQAALLVRHSPPAIADAFCAARLGDRGGAYGTLPEGLDLDAIVERARIAA